MTTEEYQKDLVVFREEKTRIFRLLYPNPISVATAIRDLYGNRVRYSEASGGDYLGSLGGAVGVGAANRAAGNSGNNFGNTLGNSSGDQMTNTAQFARNSSASGQFSRQGSSGSSSVTRLAEEKLTVDQIEALTRQMNNGKEASAEMLKGVTAQEADIFIVVLPDQNTVAVRSSDMDALDNIAGLIKEMDQPTAEVLLEMKILDLTLGDSFHSLFDVQWKDSKNKLDILGTALESLSAPTLAYKFIDDHVKLNIELLQKDNRVDVLATPILMASNNRPAQIFIGEERVIVTGVDTDTITTVQGSTTTFVTAQTEVRNIGNTLRILPKINADRTITLAVQQDTSSVLPKSTSLPVSDGDGEVSEFSIDSVNTANMSGTVVAKDGMTIAIGGMIRTTVSNDIQKVPLLGDIPYLGVLFSKEVRDRRKTEMVLLITPHIMMAPSEASISRQVIRPQVRHPYLPHGDKAYEYYFDKFDPEGADDRPWSQPPNPNVTRPRQVNPPADASMAH